MRMRKGPNRISAGQIRRAIENDETGLAPIAFSRAHDQIEARTRQGNARGERHHGSNRLCNRSRAGSARSSGGAARYRADPEHGLDSRENVYDGNQRGRRNRRAGLPPSHPVQHRRPHRGLPAGRRHLPQRVRTRLQRVHYRPGADGFGVCRDRTNAAHRQGRRPGDGGRPGSPHGGRRQGKAGPRPRHLSSDLQQRCDRDRGYELCRRGERRSDGQHQLRRAPDRHLREVPGNRRQPERGGHGDGDRQAVELDRRRRHSDPRQRACGSGSGLQFHPHRRNQRNAAVGAGPAIHRRPLERRGLRRAWTGRSAGCRLRP